jgi:CRISPR-associated protein Cas2
MLVICLSDVADRFHGFLRSAMLNPHPGVYLAMDLDAGSRERIWAILEGWWEAEPCGMGVMLWRDPQAPMRMRMSSFGAAKRTLVDFEGHWALVRPTARAEDAGATIAEPTVKIQTSASPSPDLPPI